MNFPRVSIVINTLNRASALQKVLESLQWLQYQGEFEVIVVNGPSTDNTEEILAAWSACVRAGKCDVANLSVSRNIGICMAQGEIVAFIDDDAIPEPEWLAQLVAAYDDPAVGAAGGLVYNHTGYEFQYTYCLTDRFANADLSQSGPKPHLSFPKSESFPHLLGCNSSFRRTVLLEIGGFDEEYEYFLDETDVCLRVVDAGYIITQLPNAYVHHKYAASHIRTNDKVILRRYPIIKNKIYFMLKHAREFYSIERILQEQQSFIHSQRNDLQWCFKQGFLSEDDAALFEQDLERALEIGLKRGLEGVAASSMIDQDKMERYAGDFLNFIRHQKEKRKSIVLLSRDYPPNHGGGIATFTKDLAESLAALGHIVHVITQSHDINRVDFENGVWLHRILVTEKKLSKWALERQVPQSIWNWSATALQEARRIATHRKIDVVEAPVWDCEGVAFLDAGCWPLVTSLQTTLYFWIENNSREKFDEGWVSTFLKPMLEIEKEIMTGSQAVRSISKSIAQEIEKSYQFKFSPDHLVVSHLGIPWCESAEKLVDSTGLEVLFVGRNEFRKGIDILLKAIPLLVKKIGGIRFKIIGDNTLLAASGMTFMEQFYAEHVGAKWLNKVVFEGRVSQEALVKAYKSCDIFVAPSRFESFGLIFLEAMRESKPVIGCNVGGMPEIVSHGKNGLLVEPGNSEQLCEAIMRLAASAELRKKMGEEGNRIFRKKFTARRMAEESAPLYDLAQSNFSVLES